MTDIARERSFLSEQGLDIVSRETWGAVQPYTSDREVFEPVEGFVLHISVTIDHGDLTGDEHVDMQTIERIGQERFGIGFPYNAAIFDTGRLYEGQPLTRRGAHTVDDKNIGYKSTGTSRSMNFWWRAIVLPQMVDDDVTGVQVDQCARWAAAQIRAGYAKRDAIWIGHRDVAWKGCPGDAGYARLPQIRALTEHYVINGLSTDWFDMATKQDLLDVLNEWSVQNKVNGATASVKDQVTWAHYHAFNADINGNDLPVVLAGSDAPTVWYATSALGKHGPVTQQQAIDLCDSLKIARWSPGNEESKWARVVAQDVIDAIPTVDLWGGLTPPPS